MNRRDFIRGASIAAIGATAGLAAPGQTLKPGLNAYSFNKMLNDAIRKRGPGITLDGVLEFAAKCKFAAFDPTGYFMPGYPKRPDDAYIDGLKKHAADLGIAISGTGVRNNFTTADKDVRAQGVAHIKDFVEVAARLGAPVIRVFADTQMKAQNWTTVSNGASRKDVLDWIASALRECADHAQKYNVKIGVQNHGDFSPPASSKWNC
jgi:sugar phosphate isomerase/epimerase